MAHLGWGIQRIQRSPLGVRDATSWGINVVPSLVPLGSCHRGTCHISQEVKNLRYCRLTGLSDREPFYLMPRHTAEYIGCMKLIVCLALTRQLLFFSTSSDGFFIRGYKCRRAFWQGHP